jgi:hypothetical protein
MKYFVQAAKAGHWDPWRTDAIIHDDLPRAIEAGQKLVAQFGRKVRIVDETEKVCWRSPVAKKAEARS